MKIKIILGSLLLAIAFYTSQAFAANEKQYIVMFDENRMSTQSVRALSDMGAAVEHEFNIISAALITADDETINKLKERKDITRIVEDMPMYASSTAFIPQIGANAVHNDGAYGNGVKVCVIDTGIQDNHPALTSLVDEVDFVNGDSDATDDNGHGTHVAGIIASNDGAHIGVAPNASLMAAKVLDSSGSGSTSNVIKGIEWCVAHQARVISLSLGGGGSSSHCDTDPSAAAANKAVDQGVVVVAASGNGSSSTNVSAPACGSKVIAVGAVDASDKIASFSNKGKALDISAPGVAISSTWYQGGFKDLSGTSMATPVVSGVIALLLSTDSSLTPSGITDALYRTAKDLGTAGYDTVYGNGRVDALAAYNFVKDSDGGGGGGTDPVNETIFADDFEDGSFAKWTESQELRWNTEWPSEKYVPGLPQTNLVAHADRCRSTYGCYLTMKNAIDLTQYTSAKLVFYRYVDDDIDSGEYLKVQAYNGSEWITLYNFTQYNGDDDYWYEETIDITKYRNSNFKLRFISKESSGDEDTEVDNVKIIGTR